MKDMWLSAVVANPSHILCQSAEGRYSKEEFQNRIFNLQQDILYDGREKWLLYEENGFEFLCGLMALLMSGCTVVVPGNNKPETLKELLSSDTGYVGSDRRTVAERYHCSTTSSGGPAQTCTLTCAAWGTVVFCSSGSTGKPKLIEKTAAQLFEEVLLFADRWKPNSNTLFVPLVPHFHIYGLTFGYLLPLLTNASFYEYRKRGLLGAVEPMNQSAVETARELFLVLSPSFARQYSKIVALSHPHALLNAQKSTPVSKVFCAGGVFSSDSVDILKKGFNCSITEIYGSTETGAIATRKHKITDAADNSKAWKLLPGIACQITEHSDKEQTRHDEQGIIGFWGNHVGGSEKNPVIPGDEARKITAKEFQLLGRNNQICKIEGKRVSLVQFEEILNRCSLITSSFTVSAEKNNRQILQSGIVLSESGISCYRERGKHFTDNEIKSYLLAFYDPVLIPRTIRFLDKLPETDMGKISRNNFLDFLSTDQLANFPIVTNTSRDEECCSISLTIPVSLSYFRGHFSGRPIVPGVVLVHWVYHYAREYLNISLDPSVIKQLKFSTPAGPGDTLILKLVPIAKSVRFSYLGLDGNRFSSAEIPVLGEA